MKITPRSVTIRELVGYEKGKDGKETNTYVDDGEGGVVGLSGALDIRPPYQREFVYQDRQRNAVVETARQGYPLNVFYWADRGDGTYEVLDGQQRTISLAQYISGQYSIGFRYFHNLTDDEKNALLDYELLVYVCEGSDSEKLAWFQTINIAGEKLTDQELRNAVYHGTWLTAAKPFLSRSGGPAYQIGKDYVSGSPIRQDYLQTALRWIADRDGGTIEDYMAKHQHDANANDLWLYYQSVIAWARAAFPTVRREMKSVDWGTLYNAHKDDTIDAAALEERVVTLMQDEDVTRKAGIYPYLLTQDEKHLSIRSFTDRQKREAFERQGGVCPVCGETFVIDKMEADHITPWSKGGRTTAENCRMLCADDNRKKSNV